MNEALVSAVIPTYNRAVLLCRAIDSVLAQTHPHVEAVIIDDGSTDDTSSVVTRKYSGDSRVRYMRVENGGVSRARNIGLKASRGEFVAFLDSDDYWLPWKTELQLKCLQRAPSAGMIWTNMTAVSEDGAVVQPAYLRRFYSAYSRLEREGIKLFGPPLSIAPAELGMQAFSAGVDLYAGDIFSQMILGNLVHTSTALLRRGRLEQVSGFREDLKTTGEDYDFHLQTCRAGPVAFIDVDSIGYTVGRSDQLTAPRLLAQLAQNTLLTLQPILEQDRNRINLPPRTLQHTLAEIHGWVASTLLEAGRQREAFGHAWRSVRMNPLRREPYFVGIASLLPPRGLSAMRRVYRLTKSAIRS